MFIGNSHSLTVSRTDPDTHWLANPDGNSIPLPATEAPELQPGDTVEVFIYTDSQAQPVATVNTPAAKLGECAYLQVRSTTDVGAFLDWGIAKDLLLPFNEQRRPIDEGNRETVLVYCDNSGRLAATSRLDHHLQTSDEGFTAWQEVSLLVFQRTDLGFKAVVDNRAVGLLYKDEIYGELKAGQKITGFVKRLRPDHRLDLALQPPSHLIKNDITEAILLHLKSNDGISMLTDKSAPDEIYAEFGVSKKNFKRGLSTLYKQKRITIETDCVRLVRSGD